ncbi:MAG: response regulator [Candidatus Omnitrophota bacterium]
MSLYNIFPFIQKKTVLSEILIVDNDKNFRTSLSLLILKVSDYTSMHTKNPDKALLLLKKQGFSLLITDYFLPKTTGIDLALKMKKIKKDIKPLIFSTFISSKIINEAKKYDIPIFSKFLLPDHMMQVILSILKTGSPPL